MESLRHLIQRARLVWHARRLELLANYIVEVSVPTIILFCVICKGVDNLYKWKMFQLKGLHQSQVLHGSDEGLWAKTSAIYINCQHLCELHKKE